MFRFLKIQTCFIEIIILKDINMITVAKMVVMKENGDGSGHGSSNGDANDVTMVRG